MLQRKKTTTPKPKGINFYLILLVIMIGAIALVFNDFGLFKLIKLQREHNKLNNSLMTLLEQQEKLREQITKLQTDNAYIEQVARERFMMVLPGEKVYRVQDRKKY